MLRRSGRLPVHRLRMRRGVRRLRMRLMKRVFNHLDLEITRRCNMGCAYCYMEHNNAGPLCRSRDMQPRTIDAAMRFVARHRNRRSARPAHITVYGGEPLLYTTGIGLAQVCAADHGLANATWSVLSNGTVGTPALAAWLKSRKIGLQRSFDGAPGCVDPARERLREQYLSLTPVYGDQQKMRRSTIQPEFAGTILKTLRYYESLGWLKGGAFMPNFYVSWSEEQIDAFSQSIRDIATEMIEDYRAGKRPLLYDFWLAHAVRARFQPQGSERRGVHGCGAGRSLLCATVEGNIVPCHRFGTRTDHAHGTCAGTVDELVHRDSLDGIFSGEFRAYLNDLENGWEPEECRTCELSGGCHGFCPHMSLILHGGFGRCNPNWCRWMHVAAEEIRRVDAQLRPIDPQWFAGLLKRNRRGNGKQRGQQHRGAGQGNVSAPLRSASGELDPRSDGRGEARVEQAGDRREGDRRAGSELVDTQ